MFFQLGTRAGLSLTFDAAGFKHLVEDRLTTTLHYDSGADAIGAAFIGGPVALAYWRFDAARREEAHAEYLASIERFRQGDAYAVPGEFVVVRGIRPA